MPLHSARKLQPNSPVDKKWDTSQEKHDIKKEVTKHSREQVAITLAQSDECIFGIVRKSWHV